MAGSIIVDVRVALATALSGAITSTPDMEEVHVDFQYPLTDNEPRECVWTQNGRLTLSPASLRAGRNFLDEIGEFDVVVKSWQPATTAPDAARRATEIARVAIEWIGDHKNGETLNIAGLQTLTVSGSGVQAESLEDNSVSGRFSIPVRYTARLQ